MQIFSFPFSGPHPKSVTALGCFDGTHKGHAALFARTVALADALDAVPAVFTFSDFLPAKGAPLSTLEERLSAMEAAGIRTVFLSRFEEVRHLSPEEFIENVLKDGIGAAGTVCGFNYRFGAGAKGNAETLRAAFAHAEQVEAVTFEGTPISSTRIREAITAGAVEKAGEMLGRPYTVSGTVLHGKALGQSLGFPTANIAPVTLLPKRGVYKTAVRVDGREYVGLTDVGVRPTVEKTEEVRTETFLLDFEGDLYEKSLSVSFLYRLRDEMRFESGDALRAQIKKDVESVKDGSYGK